MERKSENGVCYLFFSFVVIFAYLYLYFAIFSLNDYLISRFPLASYAEFGIIQISGDELMFITHNHNLLDNWYLYIFITSAC